MTTRSRTLTQSISIDATPQKVWELITRIDAITTWYDTWDSVEADSADPILLRGSEFRLIRNQRHPVIATCVVIELSEHRRLQWRQSTPNRPTTTVTFDLITQPGVDATELRQTRTWVQ